MTLTSHQPDFLPYLGFFWKVAHSDALVLSDDVQFSKQGMHNWNQIKTPNGPVKLTIPVHAHHDSALWRITVSEPERNIWKAIKTIDQNYRKAAHYQDGAELLDIMEGFGSDDHVRLMDLNLSLISHIMRRSGIKPVTVIRATGLGIRGHKDERIFQMCDKLKVDTYLSGRGAASYHQAEEYLLRGIGLVYTDYEPVPYPQLYGDFVPNLSVLDFIFNCGYDLPRGWKA